MALEWQKLWPRVWLLAGVASDIPEEGDYFTFAVGAEEFVLVRQADASVKAFYNVCPHRGNRVVLNERGSVPRFTCAFHGWQFGCNGKLERITDEETFNPKLIAHRPGPHRGALREPGRHPVHQHGSARPAAEAVPGLAGRLHRALPRRADARGAPRAHHLEGQLEDRRRCLLRDLPPAVGAPADPDGHGGLQPVRPVPQRREPHDRADLREVAPRGRPGRPGSVPARSC